MTIYTHSIPQVPLKDQHGDCHFHHLISVNHYDRYREINHVHDYRYVVHFR